MLRYQMDLTQRRARSVCFCFCFCVCAWFLAGCDVEADVSTERQNVPSQPDATSPDDTFAPSDAVDATDPDTLTEADTTATSDPPDTTEPPDTFNPPDTTEPPDTTPDTTDSVDPPDPSAAIYTTDRTLSPLTPFVAARLREIAARDAKRQAQVFAKVGDSVTVNYNFLHCFSGPNVDLAAYSDLEGTLLWFDAGDAAGSTPFARESLAATIGWSAFSALSGTPSPLEQEVSAVQPRYAVVMFGTNDVEIGNVFSYAEDMLDIADILTEQGIIPIFSTVMPRDDNPAADALVPQYNMAVRAIAQARQVPLIDLHRELLPLPDHGLSGDQVHPKVYRAGQGCVFTPEALAAGYNLRNLLTLQSLDRVRKVLDGAPAPDAPEANPLQGDGSAQAPFVIASLPFSDVRDTTASTTDTIDTYTGCNATQNESGAEVFYRLDVAQPTNIRALVFDRGNVDIDLHLLADTPTAAACLARNHQVITRTLQPGTYHFSLDTFVDSNGDALGGEFIFVLMQE